MSSFIYYKVKCNVAQCSIECVPKMISLKLFLLCVSLIYGVKAIASDEHKIFETNNGQVRGVKRSTLLNNVSFYACKGIPYAKPPVGDLRFKVYV